MEKHSNFLFRLIAIVAAIMLPLLSQAEKVTIASVKELAEYALKSGNTVTMKPGKYKLTDYLPLEVMAARREQKEFQFITFSGSNNAFNLEGVELEVNTELRTALKPPIHTSEFIISGSGNTLSGLHITCVGNGTSPGGALLEIAGSGNTLRNTNFLVKGSFPYGYGDLFGKGGPDVIRHQKHSGVLITGSNTRLQNCKLYMKSFGHGFYIQKDAGDIYFEDCYVEGESRSTDDILKETSGPAVDVNFRTWTKNREGEFIVTPGYMKSLCEDGFRTYNNNKNINFKNCTAKNTRGGFELRSNGGTRLENCTTIGTERAYWVGNDAVVINCKGDANYGPLLFVEGNNVQVEMEVVPSESDMKVHALATIQGRNNTVTLKAAKGVNRKKPLPILIGYTHPEHGESMSPYGEGETANLNFRNETTMPVVIGEKASNSAIATRGPVQENKGKGNTVKKLSKAGKALQ